MWLSTIKISNFRGIDEAEVNLSSHVCSIGPNNSGKSTFLMAISLFLSGSKLTQNDYYDPDREILFSGCIDGIVDSDIELLADAHKAKITSEGVIKNGKMHLIRRYDKSGKSNLTFFKKLPKDHKFYPEEIQKNIAGKRGKDLKNTVTSLYSELSDYVGEINTHSDLLEQIQIFVNNLPESEKEYAEAPLPTGIDKSISVLLPDVIYIPAVKDISDDVKTKESTSFGKVLKALLEMIVDTEQMKNIQNSFDRLNSLLNRTTDENGSISDKRLPQLQEIESIVEKYLSEQFPQSELEFVVPPPEIKTIFSGAQIFVNDGFRDVIENKGDGMKRAVIFALLRTLSELADSKKHNEEERQGQRSKYLFLFEEPELYLHPYAQTILYEALSSIAKVHQVCITSHSPYFLSPTSTETFLRFRKEIFIGHKPFTRIKSIDVKNNVMYKDAFKIICYENNNAAFFCDLVVLCEGNSDIIYLKHLFKHIDKSLSFEKCNIGFIQVGGKGSFAQYKKFFEQFGVDVQIIADLDVVLDQFDKLGASDKCSTIRNKLLQTIDKVLEEEAVSINSEQAKNITNKRTFLDRYNTTKTISEKISKREELTDSEVEEFGKLFAEEDYYIRKAALKSDETVKPIKVELISALRDEGIHVLIKGSIEDYYPRKVGKDDKLTSAINACELITNKDEIRAICEELDYKKRKVLEIEAIFDSIFHHETEKITRIPLHINQFESPITAS